jgi:hypothetical protein
VVGSSDGPLSIFINTGLIAAGGRPGGRPDCARPVFRLLEGNTDPFRGLEAWQLPDQPSVPSLGDLDGDGDLDLATGSSSGMPSFENQDGEGGLPRFLPFSSARCGLEEVANPPSSPLNDYTSNLALEDACTGLSCNSWSVPLLAGLLTMAGLMVMVLAYVVLTQTSAKTGGGAGAACSAARGIWIDGIWIDLGAAEPGSSSGYGTTLQPAPTPNYARTRNEPPAIVNQGVMVDGIWIDFD